jgi:hypothetical protein
MTRGPDTSAVPAIKQAEPAAEQQLAEHHPALLFTPRERLGHRDRVQVHRGRILELDRLPEHRLAEDAVPGGRREPAGEPGQDGDSRCARLGDIAPYGRSCGFVSFRVGACRLVPRELLLNRSS